MKKIYTIDVPYCAMINVRVEADSILDDSDALDRAMGVLDNIESLIVLVDGSGNQIDPELISIHAGCYTERLSLNGGRKSFEISWEEQKEEGSDDLKGSVLHLDAGNDKNGNPRRCFVIFSSSGRIIDAIDEEFYGCKAYEKVYPKYVYLGKFKTSVSEYKQVLKSHSRQLS